MFCILQLSQSSMWNTLCAKTRSLQIYIENLIPQTQYRKLLSLKRILLVISRPYRHSYLRKYCLFVGSFLDHTLYSYDSSILFVVGEDVFSSQTIFIFEKRGKIPDDGNGLARLSGNKKKTSYLFL